MINKKYLPTILFVIALSCNSDSDVSRTISPNGIGPEIRLGGQIVNIAQSKAIIDGELLPDKTKVGVFGWGHHIDAGENVNTTLRKDLSNSLYIKETGVESLVTETHGHYPVSPDTLLNIYAYLPYQAETANLSAIPFQLKNQEDVMWATPVTNLSKTDSEKIIKLKFNHLLSAITIKFKKADDIQEEMILESIALENYPSFYQLNIQDGKLNTADIAPSNYVITEKLSRSISKETVTITTDALLLPTTKPVFIVRMSNNNYRIPSQKAFLPNKKQTYEFTIQAKDISLSGSVAPWEDGGTSDEIIYF